MQARFLRSSIRVKLLGGVLAVEVLLAAIFAVILTVSFRQRLGAEALRSVQRSQGVYDLILKGDTKMLSTALAGFLTNGNASQIYAEHNDRQRLLSAVQDLYVSNRARHGITHFYFIDKEGTCYLRVHKPEQFGDTIARETFLRARATGATASGIELGKTAFALRVVTPYLRDGRVLGFVEMGEEIDHFDTLVKQETGVDVAVLVDKRFLKEADYRGVRRAAGQPDDWDDLPDYALVSSTVRDHKLVAESLPPAAARLVEEPEYLGTVTSGQHRLAKGAFPLRDSARNQVGVVLVLTDVTEQVNAERMALVTLALVALVTLLLTFGAAAWFLRSQIIGPLVALSEQAIEISMGNVDKKLETARTDEIGQLINSFERMRLSLKKAFAMLSRKTAPPISSGSATGRN
ncbi:MAG TPA: cache domain-containing protein [Anaeromyxobacteraceae bacterium]|nr:cache domain-containing protein [Anaeromyxobacteraceae bacterium]